MSPEIPYIGFLFLVKKTLQKLPGICSWDSNPNCEGGYLSDASITCRSSPSDDDLDTGSVPIGLEAP